MLYRKEKTKHGIWGIWKIEESREELLSCLDKETLYSENIMNIKSGKKIIERLAIRVLLKKLLNKKVEIAYLDSGKPYIKNDNLHISISHSKEYVALILSRNDLTGIDIQCFTEKVKNIRSRFISDKEYIQQENELTHLLLHWSAKETLYKAFGKGINLKEHFYIQPFHVEDTGIIYGIEKFSGLEKKMSIHYEVSKDFVFTCIS